MIRAPGGDTLIWHYFDFAKFVSLLESRSLFFPSASNLEDPFEGAIPYPDATCLLDDERSEEEKHRIRDLTLISSWHINSDESFAMWRLYSKSPEAVAIRTTVDRLKRSLQPKVDHEVQVASVEYIDYSKDRLNRKPEDHLAPFLCKAKPYAYENEVRAIVDLTGRSKGKGPDSSSIKSALQERGAYLPVDLHVLLERVYVAPSAGRWFHDLVLGILRKYDLSLQPEQSSLSSRPVY